MNLNFSSEQQQLIDRVAQFCATHCTAEAARELDRSTDYPQALHQALAESGLLGHCLPSAVGGGGGGLLELALLAEGLGKHSSAAVNILFPHVAVGTFISMVGTPQQKEQILRPLIAGQLKVSFALAEANAGSDAAAIETFAQREESEYCINGTKAYATGGMGADQLLVVLRTSREGKANKATSVMLVPTDAPGLERIRLEKIAGNATATCRVQLSDVRVPLENRVGPENYAWSSLMLIGGIERIIVAASSLGNAQTVLEHVREFATQREQFGQPISRFQAVSHRLVDMATEIEAMRWLVYRAGWLFDAGKLDIGAICMAKLYAVERLHEILMQALRIRGGQAYLTDCPLERHLREAMLGLYAGGTAEIQRNIIAKQFRL